MGNEQDTEEGVFYSSAVPAVPLHTEVALWIMWESLWDAFFVYVFGFVLFMLRANLMAHCSRFFRDGMR